LIYLDSSALVKLITEEQESRALQQWLNENRSEQMVTNMVGIVETKRVAARIDSEALSAAVLVLARVDRLEVLGATYALAADLPPVSLRTLDALHVASAVQARDVTAFLTYDVRMAEAAALVDLPVFSPR
jgi:predicted nucleic acid-binding protein